MKSRKTFLYEDLGFPVRLINCPMKKRFGEWTLDLNLAVLQRKVIIALTHKPFPLTGKESRFIRKYFGKTTSDFGKVLGVTHAAVSKWECELTHYPGTTDLCIRLWALEQLKAKDEEFGQLYHKIGPALMTTKRKIHDEYLALKIDASFRTSEQKLAC